MIRFAPWALCAALLAFGLSVEAQQQQVPQPPSMPQASGYSASALYNRANAYARAGQPGLAVLNYQRAKLLAPNDPDIEANLQRVREASGLRPQARAGLDSLARFASPTVVAWIGVLGLLIAGLGMLARERAHAHRGQLLAVAFIGFCLIGVTLGSVVAVWPALHGAVVVGHAVPVRVSPTLIEEPIFNLPEAEVVGVQAEHDGFMLIKTGTGRTGWAPAANLALIAPQRP